MNRGTMGIDGDAAVPARGEGAGGDAPRRPDVNPPRGDGILRDRTVKASRRDPDRQVALAVERYAVGIRSHWKERDFSPALEIPKRNSGLSRAGHEPPVLADRQVFAIPDARERVAYQYLEFSTGSELQDLELGPGDLSGEATAIPTDPRHQAPQPQAGNRRSSCPVSACQIRSV